MEKIETITVDGVVYQVTELAPVVQKLVANYQTWSKETEQSRSDMLKGVAALRDLSREIGQAVREANAARVETVVDPVLAVETVAGE